MTRSTRVLLEDILESIARITQYTEGMDESTFESDEQVQDAVVRRLEVIGEAVKGLPEEVRSDYSSVPWRDIAGTRDILIHEYFRVDLELAWNMIHRDLPNLRSAVQDILNDMV